MKQKSKEVPSKVDLSNSSFLNELPEDIKKEVVENISQQKELLEKAVSCFK